MSSIFVSYRRTDAPAHAGRIFDRLVDRLGKDSVYKDLDSTAPGDDFAEVINDTIAACDVLVAVIGRNWLSATRRWRRRRQLNGSQDWVRREIAAALERNIRVVPVLVEGARMPSPDDLPDDVKLLARRHAVELSETAWTPQLNQLIDSLAAPSPCRDARDRLVERPGKEPAAESPALERAIPADGPALDPAQPPVRADEAATAARTPALPHLLMRDAATGFVGRTNELAVLHRALEQTADRHPVAVLLEGEPGIGKTRLALEFARRKHAEGTLVLYGRCPEEALGTYQPFVEALTPVVETTPPEALRQLLGRSGGELTRLLPGLAQRVPGLPAPIVDAEGERLRLFAAVAGLLRAASRVRPVILVLDDVHWADRPSAALLRYIAEASGEMRLLIVGTSRDTEPRRTSPVEAVFANARQDGRAIRLRVGGLTELELETLVAEEAADRDAPLVSAALFDRTAGNPFFARELLRHLRETGLEIASRAELDRAGIPLGVKQAIDWRLRRLSEATQRTLKLAALLGPDFTAEIVVRVAGLDEASLVDVLDEAVEAGLLIETGSIPGHYGWRHALISETLVDTLTDARRAHHHHRIAAALERHDPASHLAELAYHLLAAAPLAGSAARARAYATRAAENATAQLAHDEAARLLRLARAALDFEPKPREQDRVDVLLALGEAELRAGDDERSRETYSEAVARARLLGDPERLARAALGSAGGRPWSGFGFGRTDEGLRALLEEALAALDNRDSALRSRVLSRLATELYWSNARPRGIALSREALAMARRVRNSEALASSLYAVYVAHLGPDSLEHRTALAQEMRALAERSRDPDTQIWADHFTLIEALERGDIVLADEALRSYVEAAIRLRHPLHRWHAAFWTAMRHLLAGRFEEAEHHARRAYALGERAKDPNARQTVQAQLATVRWQQGRGDEIVRALEDAAQYDRAIPAWHTALAHLYSRLDRAPEARATFERIAVDNFSLIPRDVNWIGALANLAETCSYLRDFARAQSLSRLLEPYADRVVLVGHAGVCMGAVAHYLGILAETRGDHADAIRHFAAAVAFNERLGARPQLAYTRHAYGRTLLARGKPEDATLAKNLLARALSDADLLGMRRLSENVRATRAHKRLA